MKPEDQENDKYYWKQKPNASQWPLKNPTDKKKEKLHRMSDLTRWLFIVRTILIPVLFFKAWIYGFGYSFVYSYSVVLSRLSPYLSDFSEWGYTHHPLALTAMAGVLAALARLLLLVLPWVLATLFAYVVVLGLYWISVWTGIVPPWSARFTLFREKGEI
ncbi:hypothetical protein Atc_1230 [Acidithiobacillus caldus SM-1]|uniref:Uncharacterized protein n=1 Tax=Acidithiobacillus caldus (strain SM-1) TaxID=990288 RepID=F9ZMX0_ACICS|nr:hypothetical protein [Acidithiobacillus caldus]AEK57879.1 hypothetical protein Atc_1230 [Acidithiobacillus caldus SM-1]